MSFNDYAQYILHKYRLAVALGVIQTKPDNITIEERINLLRTKVIESQNTINTNVDISICEDDFNMTDMTNNVEENTMSSINSETILKNIDIFSVVEEEKNISRGEKDTDTNTLLEVMAALDNNEVNEDIENSCKTNGNLTQSTYFDGSQCSQNGANIKQITNIDSDATLYEKDTQNFCNSVNDTQDNVNNTPTDQRTINENIDSQQTILYTPFGFSNNNTHISQSQDEFVIAKQHLLKRSKNSISNDCNLNKITCDSQNISKEPYILSIMDNQITDGAHGSMNNAEIKITDTDVTTRIHETKKNNRKHKSIENNTNKNTKLTKLDERDRTPQRLHYNSNYSLECSESMKDDVIVNNMEVLNEQSTFLSNDEFNQENNFDVNTNKTDRPRDLLTQDSLFENDYSNLTPNVSRDGEDSNFNNFDFERSQGNSSQKLTLIRNRGNVRKEDTWYNNDQLDTDSFSDIVETPKDIVPFKILEELSKVKGFLNKRERRASCSSDSGFKSFHLSSSHQSGSQYSEVWINESAYCLLSFIKTSPVLEKTADITDEISKVLGKLVDKLHEEENYPKFLEELLETVDSLLRDIYEGGNSKHNIILQRDEQIYRMLLLNRSLHVINYSIEKIIIILEDTLSNLTGDEFELANADKSENICYIFHILEVLLKRNKLLSVSSQMSAQSSQDDDRILKKSSLTEMWRKKWNLSKSDVCEDITPKKTCVLSKCSEILNKLIVQAMDGYSLVAFTALQCFNLLQK